MKIEYDDPDVVKDLSDEIKECFEQDRKLHQNLKKSDQRHLSYNSLETELKCSEKFRSYNDETYLAVVHKMDLEKLRNAIPQLKPDEQKLVYLYYYRDLTFEEIARIYGISKMAVSKRHRKVKAKIKGLMGT